MNTSQRLLLAGALMLCFALPAAAQTEGCSIGGEITAAPNVSAPGMGAWEYTLTVTWDTTRHGLSHLNLLVDESGNCSAEALSSTLGWNDPAGWFDTADSNCPVDAFAMLEPGGDPSLGIAVPLIKFEYDEEAACEPEGEGTAVLTFYSDYAPASIWSPNMFLVEKHAQEWCEGTVTGVFPGLPCDPVADEAVSWGAVKAVY